MSDNPETVPAHLAGYSEPSFITAMETAMEMCREAGWTVETVIIHKLCPGGMSMWRLGARSGEAGWEDYE